MSGSEIEVLLLTSQIALLSAALVVPLALIAALFLLQFSPGKQVFGLSLLSIPMAIPPVITGYLLLITLGRQSALGQFLESHVGIQLSFTFLGAVLASSIVSFPYALRTLVVAIKSIDKTYLDSAKTLGLSPWRTFAWITLPLSWPGILGAGALAFVRAFGEFGATVVFAGGIVGESRTLSVTVWNLMQMPDQEDSMWRLLGISILFCFAALVISELLFQRMKILCNGR